MTETTRYCPMCNRRTPVETWVHAPFLAVTCQECGHVHKVGEVDPKVPAVSLRETVSR